MSNALYHVAGLGDETR